jgi:hypothetical protein
MAAQIRLSGAAQFNDGPEGVFSAVRLSLACLSFDHRDIKTPKLAFLIHETICRPRFGDLLHRFPLFSPLFPANLLSMALW